MKIALTGRWWCMALIPALRKQRQMDLSEFKDSLAYKVNSRTVTQRSSVSKNRKKK